MPFVAFSPPFSIFHFVFVFFAFAFLFLLFQKIFSNYATSHFVGRGELGSPVWPRATICISSQRGGNTGGRRLLGAWQVVALITSVKMNFEYATMSASEVRWGNSQRKYAKEKESYWRRLIVSRRRKVCYDFCYAQREGRIWVRAFRGNIATLIC